MASLDSLNRAEDLGDICTFLYAEASTVRDYHFFSLKLPSKRLFFYHV